MIRLFTIFCKLHQITLTDRQWFEKDIKSICLPHCACPFCDAVGCMESFAFYDRYLVELDEGIPVTHAIRIKRYRCTSCGHTHAALSSCLVPYRSYSLRFILTVLRCYFLHLKSVEIICEAYGIAVSTLYRWIRLFLKHKSLWLGALENLSQDEVSFMETLKGNSLLEFYRTYRLSLMENFHGTFRELSLSGTSICTTVT